MTLLVILLIAFAVFYLRKEVKQLKKKTQDHELDLDLMKLDDTNRNNTQSKTQKTKSNQNNKKPIKTL